MIEMRFGRAPESRIAPILAALALVADTGRAGAEQPTKTPTRRTLRRSSSSTRSRTP